MALSKEQLSEIKAYMDERSEAWKLRAEATAKTAAQSEAKLIEERNNKRVAFLGISLGAILLAAGGASFRLLLTQIQDGSAAALANAQTTAERVAGEKVDEKWEEANKTKDFFETTVETIIGAKTSANEANTEATKAKDLATKIHQESQAALEEIILTKAEIDKKIVDLQDTIAKAELSQKEVENQAEILRDSTSEAENLKQEAERQHRDLEEIGETLIAARELAAELEALGNGVHDIVKEAVSSQLVVDEISARAAIPSEIIIASEKACSEIPGGWTEYENARGRMILGANPSRTHGYESRPLGTTGGEETVKLEKTHLPPHTHTVGEFIGGRTDQGISAGPHTYVFPRGSIRDRPVREFESSDGGSLNGTSHENMPPYIALYFCKKD